MFANNYHLLILLIYFISINMLEYHISSLPLILMLNYLYHIYLPINHYYLIFLLLLNLLDLYIILLLYIFILSTIVHLDLVTLVYLNIVQ